MRRSSQICYEKMFLIGNDRDGANSLVSDSVKSHCFQEALRQKSRIQFCGHIISLTEFIDNRIVFPNPASMGLEKDAYPMFWREAPSVTLFLFAYNQQDYVRAACESVLAQDYEGPLEIILSDDCSSDNTFQIMTAVADAYQGHHSVRLNRNPENLGLIRHVNLSNHLATGELLVAAAGDDVSFPNRVTETVKAYRTSRRQPLSIYSPVLRLTSSAGIKEESITPPIQELPHLLEAYALSNALIIGAAHAWHRQLFETFGDIEELGAYEDLVLAYRSALLDGLVYIDQPLVHYRVGVGIVSQEIRQKMLHNAKVMLPVLRQRLRDTLTLEAEVGLVKVLRREIFRIEIERALATRKLGVLVPWWRTIIKLSERWSGFSRQKAGLDW